MINKIIHYIWVGPKKMSEYSKVCIKSWKKHNPDFEIILWDENKARNMMDPYLEYTYKKNEWAKFSDLLRLKVIYELGGIYLDTDMYCLKPMDFLLREKCFFGFEKRDWVSNAIFGAQRGHWFLAEAILEYQKSPSEYANRTSPDCMTGFLRKHGLKQYLETRQIVNDIAIYPIPYFYPYAWDERLSPKMITNDTVTAHLWEKGWGEQNVNQNLLAMYNQYTLFSYYNEEEARSHAAKDILKLQEDKYFLEIRNGFTMSITWKDWLSALQFANKLISLRPGNIQLYCEKCQLLVNLNRQEEAIPVYDEIKKLDTKNEFQERLEKLKPFLKNNFTCDKISLASNKSSCLGKLDDKALEFELLEQLIRPYLPQVPTSALIIEVNKIFHSIDASNYDKLHHEISLQLPPMWKQILEKIVNLQVEWKILDYGCGTGFEAGQVLDFFPESKITSMDCYDISEGMLNICRSKVGSRFERINFLSDLTDTPRNSKYNLLLTNSLLHHLPSPVEQINAILPLLTNDALWIAGHEPSSRFYKNPECVQFYNKYIPPTTQQKFNPGSSTSYAETAREAKSKGMFLETPSETVIDRLVDCYVAHSPEEAEMGRGFDFKMLEKDLAKNWKLIGVCTYSFFGSFYEGHLSPDLRQKCRELSQKYPWDGANFFSVWKRIG